ncbi:MAG: exodeoxyribonuclease VII small subunit [Pseudomonadota bacterium]
MSDVSANAAGSDPSVAVLSFEAALAELEAIVARLERGEVELDEAISIYERGAALRAHCESKLKDAELKVEKIVLGPDGAPRLEPAEFGDS